jgi:hypothetical protein
LPFDFEKGKATANRDCGFRRNDTGALADLRQRYAFAHAAMTLLKFAVFHNF